MFLGVGEEYGQRKRHFLTTKVWEMLQITVPSLRFIIVCKGLRIPMAKKFGFV